MTIDENKDNIINWLNAPDPSLNHNKACQARQPKTGLWLLNSSEYQKWKAETDRILWLHGIRKYRSLDPSELGEFSQVYYSGLWKDHTQVSRPSHGLQSTQS